LTGESTKPPETVGIAGSGAVACGLAKVADGAVLWARSDDSAARAREESGVSVVTELEALAEATVVVEAVVEDLAVKKQLLGRLGELLPAESLLATTTSSLSVSELAEASGRPDRFAAVHFFNPVDKMDLVELAFPAAATEATRERVRALCEALGKTVVEVPDAPGFVVNRLLFPYLFDAVRLLERGGVRPEDVDECMKLGAGHPMGPIALLDFVGLDVAAAIGESIGAEVPERLRELVAEGRLGRKSGAGFYDYD
jgi:3-hydroxybutyryl-CoA dehydrogenase